MIEEAKSILNRKHLLVVGGTEAERQRFVDEIIITSDFETFRFPKGMKSFGEYYEFVKKKKLYHPWYKQKTYNMHQILDFHDDWMAGNNSLVIMEELDSMEEEWKIELLRTYLSEIENHKKGEKFIHLIISQESENGLLQKLSQVVNVRENERRTSKQIVEQNIEIVDITSTND